MSEEQLKKIEVVSGSTEQPVLLDASGPALPRAPRVGSASRSYRAETAWIWQRARLVCAVKDPNS